MLGDGLGRVVRGGARSRVVMHTMEKTGLLRATAHAPTPWLLVVLLLVVLLLVRPWPLDPA